MNQHVIAYLTYRYNRLEDWCFYLAVKPEYGGYPSTKWKDLYNLARLEQVGLDLRLIAEGV